MAPSTGLASFANEIQARVASDSRSLATFQDAILEGQRSVARFQVARQPLLHELVCGPECIHKGNFESTGSVKVCRRDTSSDLSVSP